MQRDRPLQMTLIFILVVQSLIMVPPLLSISQKSPHIIDNSPSQNTITSPEDRSTSPIDSIGSDEFDRAFSLSDTSTFTGVLDPIISEQKGYYSTDNISARTDINSNLAVDLPIDDAHDWKASEAEIDVWNITSLYALNGTFDSGIPGTNINPNGTVAYYPDGWNATSYSPDITQLQTAAYDDTSSKFVSVENQGEKKGPSGKMFEHLENTTILWTQNASNVPYTNDFYLSFSYVYLRGPQGPTVPGNCSLTVFIDGSNVWNISLLTVPERNIWYETGRIPITTSGLGSTFNFSIGLVIDEAMDLNADADYGDGIVEGVVNVLYITSYIDDVSFIGVNQPTPEAVDLQFTAGSGTAQITGSAGSGSANIANQSYWTSSPVPASITSNGSISLTYRSRLLSHRFDNSSWTTDISKRGVSYSVQAEMSAKLTFFTYLGSTGDYQEFALRLYFPIDWENNTVLDPFQGDLTSSCTISTGFIEIPGSAIGALGWWQIDASAPNYAREIVPQMYDSGLPQWVNATKYRPGNLTRSTISIGYSSTIPATVDSVNVSWFLPDETPWFSELVSGGVNGKINSTGQVLDNSAAGAWRIEVLWTNGTEVAFGGAALDVYHKANLAPIDSVIETDFGLTVTSRLVYTDLDTSSYIMNDAATVEGNYSAGIVAFEPNEIKNWWSADLDTSVLGAGQFTIYVNATFPFFDNASCSFIVVSTNVTRLSSPNAPWSSGEWGTNITLTLNFEVYSYSGGTWGPVTNSSSDTRINVNWTTGKWSAWEDAVPGIYLLRIDTTAKPADAWLLNITISKPSHEVQQLLITLLITPEASSLSIMGDTSTQVDLEEEYNVTLRYTDSEGDPVSGATVAIDSVTPPTGLLTSSIEPIAGEPGNYTVSLTPQDAGVFTVRFVANASDTQTANTVFVLVVSDVPTSLTVTSGESAEIGLTDTFIAEVHFETYNGTGIESASISVVYSGPLGGIQWAEPAESSEGNYSIDFNATLSGTYLITIGASKQYYQSSSTSFFLVVGDISTTLIVLNGTAGIVSFGSDYRLVVHYTNGSGYGLASADVDVVSSTPAVGLGPVTVTPDGLGYFSMVLSPQIASTYTILIRANLTNHETQFGTFTLTVTPIPTYLTVLNSSVSISVDQNFTVFLSFQNESFSGLEGASFSTLSAPDGYLLSSFTDLSMGLYSVTISPLEIGTFDIVFRASLTSHQNTTAAFIIRASLIPTALIPEGGTNTNTTLFQEDYDIIVYYERTDLNTDVPNAILDVIVSDDDITYLISELSMGYRIRIGSEKVGRFTVIITAQRENHVNATTSFILDVQEIPTSLTGVSISEPLVYGHSHSFTFSYLIAQNQSRIYGAEVVPTREGYEWVYPMPLDDGRYNITIIPEAIAHEYVVLLTFTRDGFQTQSFPLSFEVEEVPVQMEMTSQPFGLEGTAYILTIELFEANNPQEPVTNAQLSYKLSLTGQTWKAMTEEPPGTYTAMIILPVAESVNDTTIDFLFLKSNYEIVGRFQFGFSIQPNQFVRMLPVTMLSGGSIAAVFVAIVARRSYNKRKRERNLEAMAIKERFDDARNIIGLIVLHKKSGLPFYSKAMKGGFDEGMISAFITAITHFRAEFGMDEKHWDFQVIPISDIISAVPTRSMVCAFVTGFSPSESQQIKMQAYGRAAGAMFDEIFSDTPTEIIDGDTYRLFESLFMDLLDVRLLRPYRRNESVAFPRSHKCMEITMPLVVDKEGFRLDELAKGMASCGVDEGRAYLLVMEAIAQGLIESTVPEEPGAVPFIDREGTELPFDESPL